MTSPLPNVTRPYILSSSRSGQTIPRALEGARYRRRSRSKTSSSNLKENLIKKNKMTAIPSTLKSLKIGAQGIHQIDC